MKQSTFHIRCFCNENSSLTYISWLSSTGGRGCNPKQFALSETPPNKKYWSKNNRKITIAIEILHNNRFCTPEKIPERKPDKHVLHTKLGI